MIPMTICYKRLWILLIERGLSRQELRKRAFFSSGTLTKLNRNEPVKLEVLLRICGVLCCDIGDICAAVPAEEASLSETGREKA